MSSAATADDQDRGEALRSPRHIHVVGAGGAGMSAIATALLAMGHTVSGSDLKTSAALERLAEAGATISVGHASDLVDGAEIVTVSSAIPEANPELSAARARDIPVWTRAEMLAALCTTRRTIAVAGTHGKTTTASMLALILVEAGIQPSFLVGGELNEIGGGALWGEGEWLVVEADESDGTFLALRPEVAVVTNVEPDHLDHYGSFAALREAFASFLAAAPVRVVSADDPVAASLVDAGGPATTITWGTSADATYVIRAVDVGRAQTTFFLDGPDGPLGEVHLPVPGIHNARNAAAAAAAAMAAGAGFAAVQQALARFGGVARRFEFRGHAHGVDFVDDYAHLPGEVSAALTTARSGGWKRIVCVFQPHRYSRTANLFADFASSFDEADVLVVTDVYAAGEQPRPGVSGKLIVDAVLDARPSARIAYMPSRRDVVAFLTSTLRPGDLCLTLGAGDLTSLPDELLRQEDA